MILLDNTAVQAIVKCSLHGIFWCVKKDPSLQCLLMHDSENCVAEMMRQAGVGSKTSSPKDRALNRQRERTRFASPSK